MWRLYTILNIIADLLLTSERFLLHFKTDSDDSSGFGCFQNHSPCPAKSYDLTCREKNGFCFASVFVFMKHKLHVFTFALLRCSVKVHYVGVTVPISKCVVL